jgi:hypothetical protein
MTFSMQVMANNIINPSTIIRMGVEKVMWYEMLHCKKKATEWHGARLSDLVVVDWKWWQSLEIENVVSKVGWKFADSAKNPIDVGCPHQQAHPT